MDSLMEARVDIQQKMIVGTTIHFVSVLASVTCYLLAWITLNFWYLCGCLYFAFLAYKTAKSLRVIIQKREVLAVIGRSYGT